MYKITRHLQVEPGFTNIGNSTNNIPNVKYIMDPFESIMDEDISGIVLPDLPVDPNHVSEIFARYFILPLMFSLYTMDRYLDG